MNPLNFIARNTLMPFSRLYAKTFVGDKPADRILTFLVSVHFYKVHKYWPNLRHPRSFEEKINWRMLYDRNPLWTLFSDKLAVRDYVAERVGAEHLVPLLWTGLSPALIPFDELPERFVIKTNHGCYFNILVKDKSTLNREQTKKTLTRWLAQNFAEDSFMGTSWAYSHVKPAIIIEQFLLVGGKSPIDYKFFCFDGRCEFVQLSFDRFGDASEAFVGRDFKLLAFSQGLKTCPGAHVPPASYSKMVEIAETLSAGHDFLRVDLYDVNGEIFFGELTCYPAAGACRFEPEEADFEIGAKWQVREFQDRPQSVNFGA